jgi:5-formaminoimidazole-4-carboxamide-1-beta-D-ribofuranosyl 5'-monophosphate synthetase
VVRPETTFDNTLKVFTEWCIEIQIREEFTVVGHILVTKTPRVGMISMTVQLRSMFGAAVDTLASVDMILGRSLTDFICSAVHTYTPPLICNALQ